MERIFAYWAIAFLGQSLENYGSGHKFWATFFHRSVFYKCLQNKQHQVCEILFSVYEENNNHQIDLVTKAGF
jgi:hypothetical protein